MEHENVLSVLSFSVCKIERRMRFVEEGFKTATTRGAHTGTQVKKDVSTWQARHQQP